MKQRAIILLLIPLLLASCATNRSTLSSRKATAREVPAPLVVPDWMRK